MERTCARSRRCAIESVTALGATHETLHDAGCNGPPRRVSLVGLEPFLGERESLFITDKGDEHRVGSQFYDAADFPAWRCRYVDLYLNNNGVLQRLEQEEMDDTTYRRWDLEQAAKYPGRGTEGLGGIFKATGVIPFESGGGHA